jgi:AP-2 complex subunit mu-1
MFTASGLRVRFLKVTVFWLWQYAHILFENVAFSSFSLVLLTNFLQVWEKSGYNTVEWVRYITKAGSYEIRC